MRELRQAGNVLCVVPQIHYEFWVVVTRPLSANGLGMTPDEAAAELQSLAMPLFRLLRDERAIYNIWKELVVKYQMQGKRAHDAHLVAAMQRHGVEHILTFIVADFCSFSGINVVDPMAIVA